MQEGITAVLATDAGRSLCECAIMLDADQFASDNPLASPERVDTAIAVRVRYFGAHLLAYQLDGDGVVIQRVLHQSQDWVDLL